ncbi:hypothetical protein [Tahibacter amnicola]|uniref:Transmembrane protein n=1 Tax=Tahibacter amnicola TaxID=2976241 RepID=A0ABY6BKR2_9GAMM|nr:hypothetical protein [Tahibacter amnicola]UXI69176.1 hypothetical protein N4264_05880 [Tahibacter amnicola]
MQDSPRTFNREREIARRRKLLEKVHWPRLTMFLMVSLTGAVGFLASYLMLRAGVGAMWIRYPLATGIAYGAFLFFLWCWLHAGNSESEADIGDDIEPVERERKSGSSGDIGSGWDFGNAGDDGIALFLVIIAVLALATGAVLAISVIVTAPALLAELLVDVALAGGLYKRVRGIDRHGNWLGTAVRRTGWIFAVVALILAITGGIAQKLTPGAQSIGQALHLRPVEPGFEGSPDPLSD